MRGKPKSRDLRQQQHHLLDIDWTVQQQSVCRNIMLRGMPELVQERKSAEAACKRYRSLDVPRRERCGGGNATGGGRLKNW